MDISVESSAVKDTSLLTVNQLGPTTTKRSAKTSVLVRSGDTVVLGGMMQEGLVTQRKQVPYLGDIPYLGWFFRFNSVTRKKTNLLIMLSPRVIRNPDDLVGTAKEQQERMDRFIDRNKGEVERFLPDRDAAPPAGNGGGKK